MEEFERNLLHKYEQGDLYGVQGKICSHPAQNSESVSKGEPNFQTAHLMKMNFCEKIRKTGEIQKNCRKNVLGTGTTGLLTAYEKKMEFLKCIFTCEHFILLLCIIDKNYNKKRNQTVTNIILS